MVGTQEQGLLPVKMCGDVAFAVPMSGIDRLMEVVQPPANVLFTCGSNLGPSDSFGCVR